MRALIVCTRAIAPQLRPPSVLLVPSSSRPPPPPPSSSSTSFKLKAIKHTRQTVARIKIQTRKMLNWMCANICEPKLTAFVLRARIPPHSTGDSTCTHAEWATRNTRTNEARGGRRRRSNGGRKVEKKENTNKSRHTHQRALASTHKANESILCGDWELSRCRHNVVHRRESSVRSKSKCFFFIISYSASVCWGGECERESTNYTRKKSQKHLTSEQWTSDERWNEQKTREKTKKQQLLKRMRIKEFVFSLVIFVGILACECVSGQHVCFNDEFECRV